MSERNIDFRLRRTEQPTVPRSAPSEQPQRPNKKRKSLASKKNLLIGGGVLIILLFSILVWQYLKTRAELNKHKNPQVAIQEEGENTQDEVSKVMVLPKGETPTIANISDVGKLKDRAFFANAENGDKVLIYKEAKKAIIYRPSTKQIVEVATYNVTDDPTAQ